MRNESKDIHHRFCNFKDMPDKASSNATDNHLSIHKALEYQKQQNFRPDQQFQSIFYQQENPP